MQISKEQTKVVLGCPKLWTSVDGVVRAAAVSLAHLHNTWKNPLTWNQVSLKENIRKVTVLEEHYPNFEAFRVELLAVSEHFPGVKPVLPIDTILLQHVVDGEAFFTRMLNEPLGSTVLPSRAPGTWKEKLDARAHWAMGWVHWAAENLEKVLPDLSLGHGEALKRAQLISGCVGMDAKARLDQVETKILERLFPSIALSPLNFSMLQTEVAAQSDRLKSSTSLLNTLKTRIQKEFDDYSKKIQLLCKEPNQKIEDYEFKHSLSEVIVTVDKLSSQLQLTFETKELESLFNQTALQETQNLVGLLTSLSSEVDVLAKVRYLDLLAKVKSSSPQDQFQYTTQALKSVVRLGTSSDPETVIGVADHLFDHLKSINEKPYPFLADPKYLWATTVEKNFRRW